jgi:hypothetical protein
MIRYVAVAAVLGLCALGVTQSGRGARVLTDREAAQLVGGSSCKAYVVYCTNSGCSGTCGCSSGSNSTQYNVGAAQDCPTQKSGCSQVYKYDTGGCGS